VVIGGSLSKGEIADVMSRQFTMIKLSVLVMNFDIRVRCYR